MNRAQIYFSLILILFFSSITMVRSQTNMNDINFQAESEFQPTIKDAVKFTELPEIRDTVHRITNANYAISSRPMFPKYEVTPINAAKMQNEPLTKLYHSLIKVGYGPIYNMPYAEVWANSTRSRDMAYGVHYKHFSSMSQLQDVGYSGFSDNEAELFGKKFYKKHTLSGDFNYKRNVMHYYGFDTINKISDKDFTKQRFQLFEPTVRLQSHYTDSSKINHIVQLSYYNLTDLYYANENNVKLKTDLSRNPVEIDFSSFDSLDDESVIEELIKINKAREKTELTRYRSLYGIENFLDLGHYDFALDTSELPENEVFLRILGKIKERRNQNFISYQSSP